MTPIPAFPGYTITPTGIVHGPRKRLRCWLTSSGVPCVTMRHKGRSVARLLRIVFGYNRLEAHRRAVMGMDNEKTHSVPAGVDSKSGHSARHQLGA